MQAEATLADEPYLRPTATLPIGHLIRISLYWLGLTAIDGAVGVFIQNRLNFGPMAVDQQRGRPDPVPALDPGGGHLDHRPADESVRSATTPSAAGVDASRTSSSGRCSTSYS